MRPLRFLLAIALLAPAAADAQRQTLGIHGLWGAFRTGETCYAISQPVDTTGPGTRPFASVGHWPGRGIAGQLHIRLSREKRPESAVLLRIDGRSFQLSGRGWDAWAPDPRADAELVAAMRTGVAMTVETRGEGGRLIRDQYRLRGAATAIDAAALGCARR